MFYGELLVYRRGNYRDVVTVIIPPRDGNSNRGSMNIVDINIIYIYIYNYTIIYIYTYVYAYLYVYANSHG